MVRPTIQTRSEPSEDPYADDLSRAPRSTHRVADIVPPTHGLRPHRGPKMSTASSVPRRLRRRAEPTQDLGVVSHPQLSTGVNPSVDQQVVRLEVNSTAFDRSGRPHNLNT